jgi:hypothetical protein
MKAVSKRIRQPVYGLLLLVSLSASRSLAETVPPPPGSTTYAGSGACAPCHPKQYASWEKTPHATTLRDARKFPAAILGDMDEKELPFRREDISHTIGGHRDQRYLTRTGDDYYALPRLWSVTNGTWRPYSAFGWQKRPFSKYCAGCHSVAFDPGKKTAAEFGVGCEACHGPGARHAATSAKVDIVQPARLPEARRDEICASCHVRGKGPGDEYFFPVGWKPGKTLDEYLIPIDIKERESVSDAIRRLWETRRREIRESRVGRSSLPSSPDKYRSRICGMCPPGVPACEACHEHGEAHSRHPDRLNIKIKCLDCHGIAPVEGPEAPHETDVHAPGYYRVHPANLWDNDLRSRCDKCHSAKGGEWIRESLRAWPARPPTEGLAVPGTREMEGYSVDRNPGFPPIVAKPREPVAAVAPRPEPTNPRPEPAPPAPPAAERSPAPVEPAAPRSEVPIPAPAVTARKKDEPAKPDGTARLIAEGKIARADAFYLDAWVEEANRKYGEVANWAIRGDRNRIFVVLDGRFDFPEGKKGDGRNVFIIPWRARTPYGERGDSTLYFLDHAACEGSGWPCDEIRRLERMPERERKLVPFLAKGIVRKAKDADIREWIDRWIRAGRSTPSGRGAKAKVRTADRVRMWWNDTYVSNGRNWEVPEGVDFNFIVQEKREMPRHPSKTGTFYFLDTGSCEGRNCPD